MYINVNSLFGYVPSANKGHVDPCGVDNLKEGFFSQEALEICQRIAEAATRRNKGEITSEEFEGIKSREKQKLDAWTPMASWKGNRRIQEEAIPNGLVMADLDHLKAPTRMYDLYIRPLAEKGIVRLCHLTPSTADDLSTGGLRIIFRQPQGMDIQQAQAWLYDQLPDVPEECKDRCVKDLSRISYFVPASYILFPENGVDGLEEAFGDITPVDPTPSAPTPSAAKADEDLPQEYMGIPYKKIVDELISEMGGQPVVGQRNTMVHNLAVNLRGLTDNNEAWLRRLIPNFGLPEDEWRKAIHSACTSRYAPQVTQRTQRVLHELNPEVLVPAPLLPEKLPRLIALLLKNVPEQYRPVVAQAVFPALGTYLNHVTFDHIDGRTMEAALMHLTIAPTSVGKSCVKDVIDHITARIRVRSAVNRKRDQQWKDQSVGRSANERAPQRPKGLVMQYVQPDMTSAALIQRLHDADSHFLFTLMDELDNLYKLKDQRYAVIKCAFDCAEWGAERVGKESVSYTVPMRYNWVASTTPGGARKFFARNMTDGTLNRLNISTIPLQEIGSPIPRYGRYTEQWDARLAPYLDNLEAAKGHVSCPQALKLIEALDQELKDLAIATDDRTFETLSFRALVIGHRKAMILWLANGCRWEKTIEDFIRWSVHYDLYCKYFYFGETIARAEAEDNACIGRRGPVNIVSQLPDTFTMDDLLQLRAKLGVPTDSQHAKQQIQKWITRHLVDRGSEPGLFVKCIR